MFDIKKIRWILFDLSGVIVHLTLTNPEGYTVGTRFFKQEDLEGFFFTKEYMSYMLGTLSHEQFIGGYLKKRKLDLSVEELNELFKKDVTPIEGMDALFQKLEKKYKLALATNEGKVLTKYKIERSHLIQYLSKIIPSYLLREVKPSLVFFKKTLEIINAKPEECIFVDDRKINTDAATSLGIKSILFENAKQFEEELYKLEII
jgi:putative hydrolase of the HAD superfamily